MELCEICKKEIKADDEIVACPDCGNKYHKSCWRLTGKMCVKEDCREKAIARREEEEKKRKERILSERQGEESVNKSEQKVEANTGLFCKSCGTSLTREQSFCPVCGTQLELNNKTCRNCGMELQEGQGFCPKCGNKVDSGIVPTDAINAYNNSLKTKKKPKWLIVGVAVVAVILIIIVAVVVSNSNKQKKIETWKSTVTMFSEKCWTCGNDLEEVGTDIGTYWKNYIYSGSSYGTSYNGHYLYSVDSAVAAAISDNSYKISSIKSDWLTIQSYYTQLRELPDSNDNKINTLWEDVDRVYTAIEEMYDCVIDVSGNYSSYISEYNDCDEEAADSLSDLKSDLSNYE